MTIEELTLSVINISNKLDPIIANTENIYAINKSISNIISADYKRILTNIDISDINCVVFYLSSDNKSICPTTITLYLDDSQLFNDDSGLIYIKREYVFSKNDNTDYLTSVIMRYYDNNAYCCIASANTHIKIDKIKLQRF